MKSNIFAFILVLFLFPVRVSAETTYTIDESYDNVPVTLVPNIGQFDSTIAFVVEGNDGNGLEASYGAVFQLEGDDTIGPWSPSSDNMDFNEKINLQFVNANLDPEVSFDDPVSWNSNYFIGSDSEN